MSKTYRLRQPLLGFAKGEQFVHDPEWNEWTRKATGDVYNYRSDIKTGEVAMLLEFLVSHDLGSIIEDA